MKGEGDEVVWRTWELAEEDVEKFEELKRVYGEAGAWDRLRGKISFHLCSPKSSREKHR